MICEALSILTQRNYQKIREIATNLTDKHRADDLIHETYLTIERRWTSIPSEDVEFIKCFSSLMVQQKRGIRESFNKIQSRERLINDFSFFQSEENEVSKEQIVNEITRFKHSLNALELIMFELHYEEGLKFTDIVRLYSQDGHEMSFQCLWKLYLPLKRKIKEFKWQF